jgi:hypothetical protein
MVHEDLVAHAMPMEERNKIALEYTAGKLDEEQLLWMADQLRDARMKERDQLIAC